MLSCCSWWFFCFCPDRFRGKRQSKPRSSRSRKKSLWRSFAALGVGIASQKLLGHRFFEDLQSACHDLLLLRFSKPLVSGEIIWIPRAYCDKCGGRKLCCRFLDAISCSLEPSVKLVQALPLSAPILAFKSEPSKPLRVSKILAMAIIKQFFFRFIFQGQVFSYSCGTSCDRQVGYLRAR